MVDYAMALEHFAFADRSDRARHERDGSEDAEATGISATKIGHVPFDAMGYPHVIELLVSGGDREIVFANDIGRIAGRPAEYVANRHDGHDGAHSGAPGQRKEGPAPAAQHIEHGYGSVEIPKGK
jgi:hypothetical protein